MKIQFINKFFFKQIKDLKTYGTQELFRKFTLLINFIVKIPIYLLAIFPCIIIRLVSPWIIIRTEKAPSGNYGDFLYFLSATFYNLEVCLILKYASFVYDEPPLFCLWILD